MIYMRLRNKNDSGLSPLLLEEGVTNVPNLNLILKEKKTLLLKIKKILKKKMQSEKAL